MGKTAKYKAFTVRTYSLRGTCTKKHDYMVYIGVREHIQSFCSIGVTVRQYDDTSENVFYLYVVLFQHLL